MGCPHFPCFTGCHNLSVTSANSAVVAWPSCFAYASSWPTVWLSLCRSYSRYSIPGILQRCAGRCRTLFWPILHAALVRPREPGILPILNAAAPRWARPVRKCWRRRTGCTSSRSGRTPHVTSHCVRSSNNYVRIGPLDFYFSCGRANYCDRITTHLFLFACSASPFCESQPQC